MFDKVNGYGCMSDYLNDLEFKISKYLARNPSNAKYIAAKLIFWNLKFLFKTIKKNPSFKDNMMHIAIEFTGGLGDFASYIKYTEGLYKFLGTNLVIDIICEERFKQQLKTLFYGKDYIHQIICKTTKNYDLQIYLNRFPQIKSYYIHRLSEKALAYIKEVNHFHSQNPLLSKNDFLSCCYSQNMGQSRENQTDINNMLHLKDLDFCLQTELDKFSVLKKFQLSENKFITMQIGAGLCFSEYEKDTRQWDVGNYEKLTELLRNAYPDYTIVQIGESRQQKINNVDIDLRDKTSLSELLILLKTAKLHISQEGGLPILRHLLRGGKSVVLFGPTDEKFFGFAENLNLSCRTCPHPCEWLSQNWITTCMKTGSNAECMQKLTAENVFEAISTSGELI